VYLKTWGGKLRENLTAINLLSKAKEKGTFPQTVARANKMAHNLSLPSPQHQESIKHTIFRPAFKLSNLTWQLKRTQKFQEQKWRITEERPQSGPLNCWEVTSFTYAELRSYQSPTLLGEGWKKKWQKNC
jgi:hypothetical protein